MYSCTIKVTALVLSIAGVAVFSDVDTKAYQEHNIMVRNFTCSGPHPKIIELKELEDGNQKQMESICGGLEMVVPPVTILHRCHGVGCCQSRRDRWLPEITEVNLTFACRFSSRSKMQYIPVREQNHTHCACQ